MFCWHFLVVVFCVLSTWPPSDDELEKRVLQAHRSLAAKAARFPHLTVTRRITEDRIEADQTRQPTYSSTMLYKHDFSKRQSQRIWKNDDRDLVCSVNTKYYFEFEKPKGMDIWAIKSIENQLNPELHKPHSFAWNQIRESHHPRHIWIPIQIYNIFGLEELCDMPEAKSHFKQTDLGPQWTISFRNDFFSTTKGAEFVTVVFNLDPDNHFLPSRYVETYSSETSDKNIQTVCDWELKDGLIVRSHFQRVLSSQRRDSKDNSKMITKNDFSFDRSPIPDKEFLASHFGVPEPPGTEGLPRWVYWIAFFAAIACFYIGYRVIKR
jgi:hypothetical protein